MKNSESKIFTIDNFLKYFFIFGTVYFGVFFVQSLYEGTPFFEHLINFLIQACSAFYFIKRTNIKWMKENIFYFITSIAGLLATKAFYFYSNEKDYQLLALMAFLFIAFSIFHFVKNPQLKEK